MVQDRIGQVFERKTAWGCTYQCVIMGIEKAGDIVDDDSYYGICTTIFKDGTKTVNNHWLYSIDEFEYRIKQGVYTQIN